MVPAPGKSHSAACGVLCLTKCLEMLGSSASFPRLCQSSMAGTAGTARALWGWGWAPWSHCGFGSPGNGCRTGNPKMLREKTPAAFPRWVKTYILSIKNIMDTLPKCLNFKREVRIIKFIPVLLSKRYHCQVGHQEGFSS